MAKHARDDDDVQLPNSESEGVLSMSEFESETEELTGWAYAKDLQDRYLAHSDSDDSEPGDFVTDQSATTIGNVPLEWYRDYPHIGFSLNGQRVLKPATKDELDNFLSKMDDPEFLATFEDPTTHKDVKLTREEVAIIERLQSGKYPDAEVDSYPRFEDFYTQDVAVEPMRAGPEPKSRFVRSKWEHQKVMKIVRAIRAGLIVPKPPNKDQAVKHYDIWQDVEDKERTAHPMHIAAPKIKLPTHAESYNPPEEFLLSDKELEEYHDLDPEDRQVNYIPQKHNALRKVGGYARFVQERFQRCLDLYLCPRAIRKRVVDPDQMLPQLPNPRDLEPYPKQLAVVYEGHQGPVKSLSVDPTGQWMVSGGDDGTVRVWELKTGYCMRMWKYEHSVLFVQWNPNSMVQLIVVAEGKQVHLMDPQLVVDEELIAATDALTVDLGGHAENWQVVSSEMRQDGYRFSLLHTHDLIQVQWHKKGDYFVSLTSSQQSNSVAIHQLSKKQTQQPFKNTSNGAVQCVQFHPTKPFLFVATQRHVRIYNLMRQELHKKLQPGAKWISSIDVHAAGDNVIVGTYDKKFAWFDMDLSATPYKQMQPHDGKAIRSVAFHRRHPLFATCGDDGAVQVFHGQVYNDLMQNPLIVPVKKLKAHELIDGIGAICVQWHPYRPWVVSAGADGLIKLFS